MKKWMILIALVFMMMVSTGMAAELQYPNSLMFGVPEGPDGSSAILVDLPADTIMTELVEFENGDYIQTFQLPYGGTVQILRYAEFDMTLEELAEGEWTGYASLEAIPIDELDRLITSGIHIKTSKDEVNDAQYDVYIIRADTKKREQVHLLQVVLPSDLGEERIEEEINALLDSINVMALDLLEWG